MSRWHMTPRRLSRRDEIRLQQQALGVRLRQTFDDLTYANVPREWLDLLRQADERIAGRAA